MTRVDGYVVRWGDRSFEPQWLTYNGAEWCRMPCHCLWLRCYVAVWRTRRDATRAARAYSAEPFTVRRVVRRTKR